MECGSPLRPFDVGRFLFLPGRKVYGIAIEAELRPEVLKEVAQLGFKHGVLVPTIHYNVVEGRVIGLGFADLTDADISIEQFAEAMRNIKGIRMVQIIHPTAEGFVSDNLFLRLVLAGERAIIMRRPGYEGFIVGIREKFGSAGEAFLYHTGYNAGRRYGQSHAEMAAKLGITDPVQVINRISASLCASTGYGKPEVVEASANPPQATVRVYGSFECELGVKAERPYSNFFRGILAGLFTQLLGRNMEAKELKCIAKGDPYCEFKITASPT
ncbi:MAG: hypothetical protein QFX33_00435 [Candidatus Nezhaarchaeota archaeon]|nr:hypothetical protein [Candidatus Nezhaarchaeota archaeon]